MISDLHCVKSVVWHISDVIDVLVTRTRIQNHPLPFAGTQELRLPTAEDICKGTWPTLSHLPPEMVNPWCEIRVAAIQDCISSMSDESFSKLLMTFKVLLAAPLRGGRQRMDATEKLLRHRFARWQAGQYNQIWRDVKSANNKRENNRVAKRIAKQNSDQGSTIPGSVLAKITRLVETGQLVYYQGG